jgi:hypothetical protein
MLVFQGESLFAIRHVDAKLVRMHHQSVDSLYASASALKCPVCVAVWNELLQAYWDRYDSHTTLSTEEKTSRMLDGIKCSELQETDLLGRKFSAFQSTISAIDYNHHMKFNFRKAPTFVLALKIAYSRMTPQYDDAKPDFGFEIYFAAFRHRGKLLLKYYSLFCFSSDAGVSSKSIGGTLIKQYWQRFHLGNCKRLA